MGNVLRPACVTLLRPFSLVIATPLITRVGRTVGCCGMWGPLHEDEDQSDPLMDPMALLSVSMFPVFGPRNPYPGLELSAGGQRLRLLDSVMTACCKSWKTSGRRLVRSLAHCSGFG